MRRAIISSGFALGLLLVAAAPAQAAGPHDGTYKGTYRTIRNDNSGGCDKFDSDAVTIEIVDGKFSRTWAGNKVDVTVAADGTFSGSANRAQNVRSQRVISMTGKIANGAMEGEYGHDKCAVRLNLKKS